MGACRSLIMAGIAVVVAAAVDTPPAQGGLRDVESKHCGSTVHEAIAAAEKALFGKDGTAEDRKALACLVQAVKRLEAGLAVKDRQGDAVLHVPVHGGARGGE